MNPYQLLIPQLLAGAVVVAVALRAVRQARREDDTHKAEFDRRMAEIERHRSERVAEVLTPERTTALRVTLDLKDSGSEVAITRVARVVEQLLRRLSAYEETIGGQGLNLTEAKAEPGQVVLTLTPKIAAGAANRVKRVAEALNLAFDEADTSEAEQILDLGPLPADVSGAHAAATLAV